MSRLAVHLVTWNGSKYIPHLFASLRKQTTTDWSLYILDNGSQDGTLDLIKKEMAEMPVSTELIQKSENLGFAGGHNALIAQTEEPYVLLLNQDMYLMQDCLEDMLAFLETHDDVAAVTPRLMRWDIGQIKEPRDLSRSFSGVVDSLGLKVCKNRQVKEKYAGTVWAEVKPKLTLSFREERWRGESALEVFGVSGAFPMFRRSALDMVAFPSGDLFDGSYHAYKEDVDLAFRLRSAGYKSYVLLDTVGYHDRSAAGPKGEDLGAVIQNKKGQSDLIKYHSYKNHIMTLYKNEYGMNLFLDFFPIIWYEMRKFFWYLLFDRTVLKGLAVLWAERKNLRAKRRHIVQKRTISYSLLRCWWTL